MTLQPKPNTGARPRGRPRKEAGDKRQALLSAAERLLFSHGLKRISVEEIATEAGTTKVTFYKHFRDKEEIALAVLRPIFAQALSEFSAQVDSPAPFREKIGLLLGLKKKWSERIGPALLPDLISGQFPELAHFMAEQRKQSYANAHRLIQNGIRSGAIRKSLPVKLIFALLERAEALFYDSAISEAVPNPTERGLLINELFFFGISSGSEKPPQPPGKKS